MSPKEKLEKTEDIQENADFSEQEMLSVKPASARSMPRPSTDLAAPPQGNIEKLTLKLLVDLSLVPSLEELQKIHKNQTSARVPLLTVIQSVIARAGGETTIENVCAEIPRIWDRPFPTSPYSIEEFVYLLVRNSDSIRVS